MRKLLYQILKDRDNGLIMSTHQIAMVQGTWLKLFGTGGCDCYPYISEADMINDLLEHFNIKAIY